ncbi:MAG: HK97 gp10 family phage protein [Bacillales bacterium]|nr:HK97 gp10 family phage protein [Bacillales bacterium]
MIKLEGMDDLLKKIEKMANADRAKEKALQKGAEHLRTKIAEHTPRSSIQKDHAADHIIIQKQEDGSFAIGPDKDHFYLQFVEFGTKKMAAKPFMAPTLEREKGKITEIMKNTIKSELGL